MPDEMPDMINPMIIITNPDYGTLTWEFSGSLARYFPTEGPGRDQNLSNLHDLTARYMALVAAALYSEDDEIASRYLTGLALRMQAMAQQLYEEVVDEDDEGDIP